VGRTLGMSWPITRSPVPEVDDAAVGRTIGYLVGSTQGFLRPATAHKTATIMP
jgi:hypothetical protein